MALTRGVVCVILRSATELGQPNFLSWDCIDHTIVSFNLLLKFCLTLDLFDCKHQRNIVA